MSLSMSMALVVGIVFQPMRSDRSFMVTALPIIKNLPKKLKNLTQYGEVIKVLMSFITFFMRVSCALLKFFTTKFHEEPLSQGLFAGKLQFQIL